MYVKLLCCVQLFVTPWTVAHQAPLSMGCSRQEYWSGLPFPSPGDLPNPGIEPKSPTLQVDSLPYEPPGKPKNPGVGSLSLLQGIFVTQKLNQCLLHCKQILDQLRNKESFSAHYLIIKIYGCNLKHSEAMHIFFTFFMMLYVDLPRPVC